MSLNRARLTEPEALPVAALPANRAAPRLAVIRASPVAGRGAEVSTRQVAQASVATPALEVMQVPVATLARLAAWGVRLLKPASVMTETTARRMSATLMVATTLPSATERRVTTAAHVPRSISVATAPAPALRKLQPQKSSVRL